MNKSKRKVLTIVLSCTVLVVLGTLFFLKNNGKTGIFIENKKDAIAVPITIARNYLHDSQVLYKNNFPKKNSTAFLNLSLIHHLSIIDKPSSISISYLAVIKPKIFNPQA